VKQLLAVSCLKHNILYGAGRGNRTPKDRSPADFESAASASSAIPAGFVAELVSHRNIAMSVTAKRGLRAVGAFKDIAIIDCSLAQAVQRVDRACAEAWGRGQVAQMVERSPEKAGVGGSIPSLATIYSTSCARAKRRTCSVLFQFSPCPVSR
jgi:hypothetical protein